jgi:hypothetical protein
VPTPLISMEKFVHISNLLKKKNPNVAEVMCKKGMKVMPNDAWLLVITPDVELPILKCIA